MSITSYLSCFNRTAKIELSPVYCFISEKLELLYDAFDTYREQLFKIYEIDQEKKLFNYHYLSMTHASNIQEFINYCNGVPVSSAKKIVVLDKIEKTSDKVKKLIMQYIQSPSPSTILILLWGAPVKTSITSQLAKMITQKNGVLIRDIAVSKIQLQQWIKLFFKEKNLILSDTAVSEMIKNESKLESIYPTIKKIVNIYHSKTQQKISTSTIQALEFPNKNTTLELFQACISGNMKRSYQVVENISQENQEPIKLLAIIQNALKTRIKNGKYTQEQSIKIIQEIQLTDYKLKTSQGKKNQIKKLLLKMLEI